MAQKNELLSVIHSLTKEPIERMSLIGVYGIKSKTNEKYYIGSTSVFSDKIVKGFLKRWICHCHLLNVNKHHSIKLQNHVNKYGIEDLEFVIIEIVVDPLLCATKEKYWLDYYNAYHNGFNSSLYTDITIGGESHHIYKNIDKQLVRKLYLEEKLTIKNIAPKFNVSPFKITTVLKDLGVEFKNHLTILPLKEIYYRNLLGKEKLVDLTKEFNVPDSTIRRQFKRFGFKNKIEILEEKMSEIQAYYNSGGNIVKYCEKMPFSYYSVYRRLKHEKE
jgi:hypothetical protein